MKVEFVAGGLLMSRVLSSDMVVLYYSWKFYMTLNQHFSAFLGHMHKNETRGHHYTGSTTLS